MGSITNSPHNYRWFYDGDQVTVECTRCKVTATFDRTAEWEKCIEWCNDHTRAPQLELSKTG